MRDDKRRGRGAAPAVIEASSRVQGPSLATVALEARPTPPAAIEVHAGVIASEITDMQGAERLVHMNAVDRARGGSWRLDNRARRRGR